jgi:O-antigen/teichoic acid export membrane protein
VTSRLVTLAKQVNDGSAFYKSVAWVAGGTATAQVISILSTPVITRLYTPLDYGVLTVFMAILGIVSPIATLTYATAINVSEDEDLAYDVLRLCFVITSALCLISALAVLLFGATILARFSAPEAAPYLWILPLCVLSSGFYEALVSWALRKKRFRTIAGTTLSRGLAMTGTKIGLGWLGIRPLGLVLGFLASQVAGCFSIMHQLMHEEPRLLVHTSWIRIWHAAKRFSRFPLYRAWSKFLLGLDHQLPVFFISAYFGGEVVGLFGLANALVSMPMALIGNSVAQVYYAEIARFGKSRPDKIYNLTISVMKKTALMGVPLMAGILIIGPWLAATVLGPQWRGAGVFAGLLALSVVVKFVCSPVMQCFDVFEMQIGPLAINVVRLLLIFLCFYGGRSLHTTPSISIAIYSVVLALFYAFLILAVVWLLRHKAGELQEVADNAQS